MNETKVMLETTEKPGVSDWFTGHVARSQWSEIHGMKSGCEQGSPGGSRVGSSSFVRPVAECFGLSTS